MAKKASPAVRLEALVVAVTKLATDFGTWKTGWGEVNRFQRVSGAIVQPFNDSLPSVPVGFASAQWGSLASFGSRFYGTKQMYGTSRRTRSRWPVPRDRAGHWDTRPVPVPPGGFPHRRHRLEAADGGTG